jgi:formylglycine-generating enzyme required for sulfatase activity
VGHRWFLSYHSPDLAIAERLEAALKRRDSEARVFLATKSLRAGGYWLPTLAEEIAQATAFVLLVGERGLGSWQILEYYEALDKRTKSPDFPLVVMLLEGQPAPGLPFLRQLHWIITPDPASEESLTRLGHAASGAGTRPGQLWRYAAPYSGLAAMTEADSDFFFGRDSETVQVISTLAAAPDRLPVLLGNSGVGKSSLAQAGVLAALKRQAWPDRAGATSAWPHLFHDSRRWCFLKLNPGTEPLKSLVEPFLNTWQLGTTDPERVQQQSGWIQLLHSGKATLSDLLDATERRHAELGQPNAPAFFLYVDQGEELYVRAEERQRGRFSELLAEGLGDPRLIALMSLRADFLGALQNDERLYTAYRQINVPPLREAKLREVVSRPAQILAARFETEGLANDLARRAGEESTKDAGALPLLSYLLDDMWTQMVKRGDGVLRLPAQAMELGGVLVNRADAFLARHPESEDELRRILTLKLATVREGEEPTRRRALRSEFSNEEWRLISELADHPTRLLITASLEADEDAIPSQPTETEAGFGFRADQTYAEVAHEAIFRRWDKLRQWIAAEREFLAWRTGLEAGRRSWDATPGSSKNDALLMGVALARAQTWLSKRAEDLSKADKEFIELSIARDRRARGRTRRTQAAIVLLIVGMAAGLAYAGWSNQSYLKAHTNVLADMIWPKVLNASAEGALRPKDVFKECSHCPEMVVIPGGEFIMGSPVNERGRFNNENPQHKVAIKSFAVSKFELTFNQWEVCSLLGGCTHQPWDQDWGRGSSPVIGVNWDDAQQYVAWLSRQTGKPYRLLSEAEWEYAARASSNGAYAWGENVGRENANCIGCGSQWDGRRTAPVGSFPANSFGLFDMAGNVWEWVQDCYQHNYDQAPTDGSARTSKDCTNRVIRGGSWNDQAPLLRSANRSGVAATYRDAAVGFRVARTLTP